MRGPDKRPHIVYLPGVAPGECHGILSHPGSTRRPVAIRMGHVGRDLGVTILGRSNGAVVAAIRVPLDQAKKLAEAVMEAVEEMEAPEP